MMRLSLLQPCIIRGNIKHNLKVIQRLVDESKGDLLVLPEYALTGSLVLDLEADVHDWALRSANAKALINVPKGKRLLINTLAEFDGKLRNCCELLPLGELQFKLFPDQTELDAGILPGKEQKIFELFDKRFKVVICFDLPHMDKIPTDNLDFILFIYHFTNNNFIRVMRVVKSVSKARELRVLVSSLVSDKNIGFSSFVDGDVVVSLPRQEGILEVEVE
jgi:predicted amidohydrolase